MTRRHRRSALSLLLFGLSVLCRADGAVGVVIAGRPLEDGPTPTAVDKVVWGPLAESAKLAGYGVAWSPQARTLTVRRHKDTALVVTVGSSLAQGADGPVKLGGKVQLKQGTCYGPLAAFLTALGLRVHWSPGDSFLMANGVVTSLQVRAADAGAIIDIKTSIPARGDLVTLRDPPREFVDIGGMELGAKLAAPRYIYTGSLVRVRTGLPVAQPPTSRIVADLARQTGARWVPYEDRCGGQIVLGAPPDGAPVVGRNLPTLTDITTVQPDLGLEMLQAKVNWEVSPEWDVNVRPPRVELVLPEVQTRLAETDLPMAGEFVDRVKVTYTKEPPATSLELFLRELIKFDVTKLAGGGAQVSFKREQLRGKTVALDAGHGGNDNGASGQVLLEKNVNLDVARRTARMLQASGAKAYLTRAEDQYVDLFERPERANRANADMFVSVHCNAMPKRNCGFGTETFYYRLQSRCLGLIMQNSLVQGLRRADRGLKQARFVVVRKAEMPAVLVELMFLNSDEEEALLQQEATRERAAAAITEGLRQFVEGTGTAPSKVEERARLTRKDVSKSE